MAITSANHPNLVDRNIRKIFVQEYTSVPNPIGRVYDKQKSSLHQEVVAGIGDYPQVGEFTDKINYNDIVEEYKQTVAHTEYAAGIQIRRKVMDDDQFRQIMQMPKQLGRAMAYRRQQDGASLYNNAFSASYTYGDGLSLCNSTHTAKSSSTNWSNTGTLPLNPANLSATRLLMRKFTSPNNKIVSIIPNLILVPIDKQDTIEEILKTTGKVDSANNNININKGRFDYIAWDFLTSTTAWYMLVKSLLLDSFVWYDRKPTEFNKDIDTDTLTKKWSSYMRYSRTAADWRPIFGQNATT